jgi:hypothetical protein
MPKLEGAVTLAKDPEPAGPFDAVAVVNRRAVPVEFLFNSIPLTFKPHQTRYLPPNVAYAVVERSALHVNLGDGVSHSHALGIVGSEQYPTEPLEGSLSTTNPVEALDRSDTAQLRHTEPKALTKDGVQSMGVGRKDDEDAPINGIPAAPEGEELTPKAVRFVNPELKRGRQSPPSDLHGGGSRTISRSGK